MLGEDWRDGLDPWQVELAESLDELVEELGRIPTTDAAYTDSSPYLDKGMNCANCVAGGDENGCNWVAVNCAPNGWCKFNVVPVTITSSAEAAATYKAAAADTNEDDSTSSEYEDVSDPMGGMGVEMPDDLKKNDAPAGPLLVESGPKVEGVHIDTPVWGNSKKRKPRNLKNIAESASETLVTAKSAETEEVAEEEIPNAITKNAELRYTLGPWYVPNRHDAHGEWTDPQELQKALWGYVENGDRDIRLQHNTSIKAGKWVEALTWPHEVDVPMVQADTGAVRKVAFPAGTVFLGVVWEPWAWELVKKGEIRGYSIGGTGAGVEVDMPEETAPPVHFLNQE